jgi:hypothetical protein
LNRKTVTHAVGAAVSLTAAAALALPGVASAAETDVAAPTITAGADGDVITMTLTQKSVGQNVLCLPIVLDAQDALPLAATPTDQWPSFLDLLGKVYYIGNPTTDAAPESTSSTGPVDGGVNTGLLKPITPGAYAVVGACFDAGSQDAVLSYGYTVVFSPGGVGSVDQALDLGSSTLTMDGGSSVVADLLTSGAGSSILFSNS